MKNLIQTIQEKLVINKHSKAKNNLPEGFRNDPLELPNNRVKFPIKIIMNEKNITEILVAYKIRTEHNSKGKEIFFYDFYTQDDISKPLPFSWLRLNEKELLMLFDDEQSVMINTRHGWTAVKWEKD